MAVAWACSGTTQMNVLAVLFIIKLEAFKLGASQCLTSVPALSGKCNVTTHFPYQCSLVSMLLHNAVVNHRMPSSTRVLSVQS